MAFPVDRRIAERIAIMLLARTTVVRRWELPRRCIVGLHEWNFTGTYHRGGELVTCFNCGKGVLKYNRTRT